MPNVSLLLTSLLCVFVLTSAGNAEEGRKVAPKTVDYNRHIRPILSKYCFACHGPDESHREAGLRLDQRSIATKKMESGTTAVVPGKPEISELLKRITTKDADTRMPPPETKRTVSAEELELLKRWISGGAKYARHWAFIKPVRPAIPIVRNRARSRNPIDNFIVARLKKAGLKASPAADRYTLIRRLSFDLRGVPPIPAEVRRFIADVKPGAYSRLVDRFLDDPRYGERWARVWLDLARYADSRGYGSDPLRPNIWRYRDWVIDAFNRNLPYDRFTIEQLAGDLLPKPTLDQKIATAFHRNTMTNTEGGTDDEEFRVAAVRDRVDTTIQVWMGLTMGCAKCHTHKYDPITQKEYYQFYAIFNQTADADRSDESPVIPAPRRQDFAAVKRAERRIAELKTRLRNGSPGLQAEQQKWELRFRNKGNDKRAGAGAVRFIRIELPGPNKMLSLAEVQVFRHGKNITKGATARQSSTDYNGPAKLAVDGNTNGDYQKAKSTTHTKIEQDPWWEVDLGKAGPVGKIVIWNRTDNKLHTRLADFRIVLLDEKRNPVWQKAVKKSPHPSTAFVPGGVRSTVPAAILAIIDTSAAKRTAKQRAALAVHYRSIAPSLKKLRDEISRLGKTKPKFPTVPVMQELPANKRRKTYIMVRGSFLQKGATVQPGIPLSFHGFPRNAPMSRLGVAKWLMHPDNPLTARVAVNRLWARIFGVGIVVTEENFGTQGELPSHPDLLDWLSIEFRKSGWDRKRLLKLIVTSATYRQSSRIADCGLRIADSKHGIANPKSEIRNPQSVDPRNRLLGRFPRVRLEAEMIRDQALSLSGLISRKMMGPSVYPPQPPGLWRAAFNGQRKWPTSKGGDKFRRGLYTFWRRTVPYPSMATFDAPSREICTVRRIRTNTPLQAFVTLNDPVYVEAAQALARRIVKQGGSTVEQRVRFSLSLCLVRPPKSAQVKALTKLYRSELAHYQKDKTAAMKLATQPIGPAPKGVDTAELAAWTVVSNILLNLDAVLTRN